MPKIVHTALVQNIHKKMGGSILRRAKGYSLMSPGQRPRNPRSQRQQQLRAHFNYLSGKWATLNTTQQELWNTHASQLHEPMSGFNDYVRINTRLLAASYSTLVLQDTPPTTPLTPEAVKDYWVMELSPTKNGLSWADPTSVTQFVQIFVSIEPGMSYTGKRRWQHLGTIPAFDLGYDHTHSIPPEIPIRYRAIVIDPQGRTSPPTHAEPAFTGNLLYICDSATDRIKEHLASDLAYRRKFGTEGLGDPNFRTPNYIASDTEHLYISDTTNTRLKKHKRTSFKYEAEYTVLTTPRGLALFDDYLVVHDAGIPGTIVLNKDTLAFVNQAGSTYANMGMSRCGAYMGLCGPDPPRVLIFYVPSLALRDQWTFIGYNPYDITHDGDHAWIISRSTHQILKCHPTNGAVQDTYGSQGSGDAQFSFPEGITHDDEYLYISDTGNNRIKKHRKSDWTFIEAYGSYGTGNVQFDAPKGIIYQG